MKNETVAVLLVVAMSASAGLGLVAGYSSELTVTMTSTSTVPTISTTTATSFEPVASVEIANASLPASAWSLSNPTVSFLQCGKSQTTGSGWITLTNPSNEPQNVTGLMIWLGSINSTEYVSEGYKSAQSCTISPSGSLTFYFNFRGPTPMSGQDVTAYVEISEMSSGYEIGFLAAISSGSSP